MIQYGNLVIPERGYQLQECELLRLNAMPESKPTLVSNSTSPSRSEIFFAGLRPPHLSIPLIIAELGWMAIGLVDTIMVGLTVGYVPCFHFGWGTVGLWIGLCLGLILIRSILLWNQQTYGAINVKKSANFYRRDRLFPLPSVPLAVLLLVLF